MSALLQRIPDILLRCTGMTVLRLAFNQINVLDEDMIALHGLRCLSELDLSNNRVTRVPIAPEVQRVATTWSATQCQLTD